MSEWRRVEAYVDTMMPVRREWWRVLLGLPARLEMQTLTATAMVRGADVGIVMKSEGGGGYSLAFRHPGGAPAAFDVMHLTVTTRRPA